MFRIAKPENFLLVSPSRKQVGQQNALECLPLVMEPQSDFYTSPLLVLDFQSLYPSVMIVLWLRNSEHERLDFELGSPRNHGGEINAQQSRLLACPGQQNALECLPLVMEPQSDFYTSPLLVLDFQSLYHDQGQAF
jgi:DNA polymerase elongation subunit (family B)